mmetsp:Transcript_58307/g.66528  ORF Transcript_58307/g.66528 Transcript_58307/m.66528 type:complete len:184 (+) Transcript_58307:51-602(+)
MDYKKKELKIAPPAEAQKIKILLMGDCCVGKTQLAKRFCESGYDKKYSATIGVEYFSKTIEISGTATLVTFWDLGGHPEFFEVRNEFYKDCGAILLMFDITAKKTFTSLDMWLREANKFGAKEVPLCVCGGKADLQAQRAVPKIEAEEWARQRNFMYAEASGNTNAGVSEIVESLAKKVLFYK